jgi:F1F0 ATPase subunit 2
MSCGLALDFQTRKGKMMNTGLLLAMVCTGAIIALFYFGSMWLTVNKLTESRQWGFWLGAGFLLRNIITVAAFWFLAAGDWQRLLAITAGFTIVRFLWVKHIQHKSVPTV